MMLMKTTAPTIESAYRDYLTFDAFRSIALYLYIARSKRLDLRKVFSYDAYDYDLLSITSRLSLLDLPPSFTTTAFIRFLLLLDDASTFVSTIRPPQVIQIM